LTLVVVFLALAVELWEDTSSSVPWGVALATAVLAAELIDGQWYILVGGVSAGIVEVLQYDE
jgi:predicted branched-subunit amino acid permease